MTFRPGDPVRFLARTYGTFIRYCTPDEISYVGDEDCVVDLSPTYSAEAFVPSNTLTLLDPGFGSYDLWEVP